MPRIVFLDLMETVMSDGVASDLGRCVGANTYFVDITYGPWGPQRKFLARATETMRREGAEPDGHLHWRVGGRAHVDTRAI